MLSSSLNLERAPVTRRPLAYSGTRNRVGTFWGPSRFIVTSPPGGDDEKIRECHVSGCIDCDGRSKRRFRAKYNATTGQHLGKACSSPGFPWFRHRLQESGRDRLDWGHSRRNGNHGKECRRTSLEIRRGSRKGPATNGDRRGSQRPAEAIPCRENTGIASRPKPDRAASADWAIRGLQLC
jgi:hypothetical protein